MSRILWLFSATLQTVYTVSQGYQLEVARWWQPREQIRLAILRTKRRRRPVFACLASGLLLLAKVARNSNYAVRSLYSTYRVLVNTQQVGKVIGKVMLWNIFWYFQI